MNSPFFPKSYPDMPVVSGVQLATAEAGIKYKGRKDLLLFKLSENTRIAGVLTQSKCPSAPVEWCRRYLEGGFARAILINSGNANAFTGMRGWEAAKTSAELVSNTLNCPLESVFLASTGVIGEPLEVNCFGNVIGMMAHEFSSENWIDAANTIMTTDTFPKVATRTVQIEGCNVTINGLAKGSGMIAPDMATMLGFIFTDAPVSQNVLKELLQYHNKSSFNSITVDSDTSTSDTVLLCATGETANGNRIQPLVDSNDQRTITFSNALGDLMRDLAQQIVKDGEGASKFVEINVSGAVSDESADKLAKSVANSPLVKTAIAGEDANWGRVVMAVGKAGEPADRDQLEIWFGDLRVACKGERDPDYSESRASEIMQQRKIVLTIDIGLGDGKAKVWTCDLTRDYVAINGDYRS